MSARIFTLFAAALLLAGGLFGQNAREIQQRMRERLPQIDALKAKEAIGENNRGLLEVRGSDASAAGIVAEENRDREAVYALIAKETGATPDAVGRARAKDIAARSKPGVWVQDESGRWVKK